MASYPVAQAAAPGDAAQAGGSLVVLGIPLTDSNVARQARRVLGVSLLMAVLAIISSVVSYESGNSYGSGIFASFLVPLCGYIGVRQRKLGCLRSFWIMNACCAGLFILSAAISLGTTVPVLECLCDAPCAATRFPSVNVTSPAYYDTCENKPAVMKGLYTGIGIGAATAILQCLGAVWGKRLAESPLFLVAAGASGTIPTAMTVMGAGSPTGVQPYYPGAFAAPAGYSPGATFAYVQPPGWPVQGGHGPGASAGYGSPGSTPGGAAGPAAAAGGYPPYTVVQGPYGGAYYPYAAAGGPGGPLPAYPGLPPPGQPSR